MAGSPAPARHSSHRPIPHTGHGLMPVLRECLVVLLGASQALSQSYLAPLCGDLCHLHLSTLPSASVRLSWVCSSFSSTTHDNQYPQQLDLYSYSLLRHDHASRQLLHSTRHSLLRTASPSIEEKMNCFVANHWYMICFIARAVQSCSCHKSVQIQ